MKLQKVGGIAALIEALAYIVGFTVMMTILSPQNAEAMTSLDKLAFDIEHIAILQPWYLFIYVVFGIVLITLAVALNERLKSYSPSVVSIASVFAFIWSGMVISSGMIASIGLESIANMYASEPERALVVWQVISIIQDAIGGGVEVVGGIWVLLISWVALKNSTYPKGLNYIGLLVGIAGIVTIIPPLGELGAVFGLGQIVWFIWLGVDMLFNPKKEEIRSTQVS